MLDRLNDFIFTAPFVLLKAHNDVLSFGYSSRADSRVCSFIEPCLFFSMVSIFLKILLRLGTSVSFFSVKSKLLAFENPNLCFFYLPIFV